MKLKKIKELNGAIVTEEKLEKLKGSENVEFWACGGQEERYDCYALTLSDDSVVFVYKLKKGAMDFMEELKFMQETTTKILYGSSFDTVKKIYKTACKLYNPIEDLEL